MGSGSGMWRDVLERKGEKVTQLTTFIKHSGLRVFLYWLVSEFRVEGVVNPAEKAIPWEQSSTRRHHILGLRERAHAGVFVLGRECCGIPQEDPSGESPEGCPRSVPQGGASISTCVRRDCLQLTPFNRRQELVKGSRRV